MTHFIMLRQCDLLQFTLYAVVLIVRDDAVPGGRAQGGVPHGADTQENPLH